MAVVTIEASTYYIDSPSHIVEWIPWICLVWDRYHGFSFEYGVIIIVQVLFEVDDGILHLG